MLKEKDDFWDSFIIVLSGIPKQETIFIGSDMNGHVGRDADGYGGVHGGMGFGTRNADGEMILEFGDAVEDSKLITYQSGDNRSMIDYLMVRKRDRCLVKDVKVISSEECVPHHRMVIGRLVLPMKPQKKKIVKFVPKPRVWKLKDEETARLFTHEMAARNDEVTKANDIQKKWLLMKETWLKGSKQVCGMTKGTPRHKETWWWNRDVEKVVAKRKVCHKAYRKSKSAEDKHTLDVAKKEVYTAMMTAQESKCEVDCPEVMGPHCLISEEEVATAIKGLKIGKAAGPTGVVSEMIKAAGGFGSRWMTDLITNIVKEGCIPDDWRKSILVPVYKGKRDPLVCGSYKAIKLLEQPMKVLERVLEKRIRCLVSIDNMQFGFMPGKGTTDAIFIMRQVQEKHHAFVDLEKAFDRVVRWALRKLGVDEWLIRTVMARCIQRLAL